MQIRIAETDKDILRCYPVMRELRPATVEKDFVAQVRRQEQAGYHIAFCEDGDGPVSVAGFRINESLSWGRFLYVDDLVTMESARSRGYGTKLLAWLAEYARTHGCGQLHLDSGLQRTDTHRFYKREGLDATGYHFAMPIGSIVAGS